MVLTTIATLLYVAAVVGGLYRATSRGTDRPGYGANLHPHSEGLELRLRAGTGSAARTSTTST